MDSKTKILKILYFLIIIRFYVEFKVYSIQNNYTFMTLHYINLNSNKHPKNPSFPNNCRKPLTLFLQR